MRLKIFSDTAYLQPGKKHVTMLSPFWDSNSEDPIAPDSGRYDRYIQIGANFFEMSTLAEADLAVFPTDWGDIIGNRHAEQQVKDFTELASNAGKPTVIFFWSDSDSEIPLGNAIVFRTSMYHSRRRSNEFAMPAWSEDFVAKYLEARLVIRPMREKAVVGFCGYAPPTPEKPFSFHQRFKSRLLPVKRFLRGSAKMDQGSSVRTRALQVLARSRYIDTNFVIRDGFWGGALLPSGEENWAKFQRIRREYVRNIVDSDFVLCARGGGNFSYRLYETLCCGRIPVFIDTDCFLPYQSEINWKEYCVWVDESEMDHLAEKVAEFHQTFSEEQFAQLQRRCRWLWEEYLSPEGFFKNFHTHFREM